MPRGKRVSFKTADGKTVRFKANPRRRSSRAEFRTEHVARKPRGWRVRTVRPGDGLHQVRIAFPPGRRRTGAGRVLEILHPRGENPTCEVKKNLAVNPMDLEKRFSIEQKAKKAAARNPGPGELVVLGLGNPSLTRSKAQFQTARAAWRDIGQKTGLRPRDVRSGPHTSTHWVFSRKRNPKELEQAADLYREFHGKEAGELLKIQQTAELRKDYAALGPLLSLRGSVGSSRWEITFDRDKPMLASSPDGHQLYILGGDQNIDACLGQMETDAERDFVDLGTVKQVVYFARKAAGNFEPIEWEHDFEDPLPRAHYDRLNQRIAITGGAYYIEAPGIID